MSAASVHRVLKFVDLHGYTGNVTMRPNGTFAVTVHIDGESLSFIRESRKGIREFFGY